MICLSGSSTSGSGVTSGTTSGSGVTSGTTSGSGVTSGTTSGSRRHKAAMLSSPRRPDTTIRTDPFE